MAGPCGSGPAPSRIAISRAHLRARDLQGARASQGGQGGVVFPHARRGEAEEGPRLSAALPRGREPLEVILRLGVSLQGRRGSWPGRDARRTRPAGEPARGRSARPLLRAVRPGAPPPPWWTARRRTHAGVRPSRRRAKGFGGGVGASAADSPVAATHSAIRTRRSHRGPFGALGGSGSGEAPGSFACSAALSFSARACSRSPFSFSFSR